MNRSDGCFPVQVEKKAMGLDHVPVMLSLGFCSLGAIGASQRGDQTIPRKKGTKEAFSHPAKHEGGHHVFTRETSSVSSTAALSVRKYKWKSRGSQEATSSARSWWPYTSSFFPATTKTVWKYNCLHKASVVTLGKASNRREQGCHKSASWRPVPTALSVARRSSEQ